MKYSVTQIAKIVDGELVASNNKQLVVTSVITDSRVSHIKSEELFIALTGENFDAHQFTENVYQKGGRIFLLAKLPKIIHADAVYILVKNTLKALQQLAAYHRKKFNIPVLAITGSNGKTVVKEWLSQLLQQKYNVCKSPKSYNSQVGVPLSVLLLEENHQLAVFEAGISKPGEMEQLERVISPTMGVLTNIGDAHQANFSSKIEKLNEKLKLFKQVEILYFLQDEFLTKEKIQPSIPKTKLIAIGFNSKQNPDFLVEVSQNRLKFTHKNKMFAYTLPVTDEVSVKNIALTLAVTVHQNWLDKEELEKSLPLLEPVSMRMELIKGRQNITIINDAYNYDLTGLQHALQFAWMNRQNKPLSLILSDFIEHGENNAQMAEKIAGLVNNYQINKLIIIGKELPRYKAVFNANEILFIPSTEAFLETSVIDTLANQTVLVKGARKFRFEKIIRTLQAQTHSTRLEINIEALRHNFQYFKSKLKPKTKIMVMVKAFAYGAGADEISHLLEGLNADYLGVAYTDEGVKLRKAGVTTPIMVMNPEPETFETLITHQLEPEIYSFRILNLFIEALKVAKTSLPYPVHIKLDTGMHRLGFEKDDIQHLKQQLTKYSNIIEVKSIFSHLTSTDNPKHDEWTEQQYNLFIEMYNEIAENLTGNPLRHILNSNGIVRFPEYQLDMVRLGIGLYGFIADKKQVEYLQNVCALYTTVSQIKTIKAGETVGYDRAGKVSKTTQTATLAIGYADGLPRILSKTGITFSVKNKQAPVVGNICMDMTMIDVTGISNIKEGDEVVIFNSVAQLEKIANLSQTIPYEILTSIPQRIKRVYLKE
jgi:alanine racemase